jgi:hypothetical protein
MPTGQDPGGLSYVGSSRVMVSIAEEIAAAPTEAKRNAVKQRHAWFINSHISQYGPDYLGALPAPPISSGRYTKQSGERKQAGTGRRRLPVFENLTPSLPVETEPLGPYITGRPPMRVTRPERSRIVAPPGGRRSREAELKTYWQNRASAQFQDGLTVRQEARRGRREFNKAALEHTLQALAYEHSPEYTAKILSGDLPRQQKERDPPSRPYTGTWYRGSGMASAQVSSDSDSGEESL